MCISSQQGGDFCFLKYLVFLINSGKNYIEIPTEEKQNIDTAKRDREI
jgi:hypothetical protein